MWFSFNLCLFLLPVPESRGLQLALIVSSDAALDRAALQEAWK